MEKFQFLIGILKTGSLSSVLGITNLVSIPYRYSKNAGISSECRYSATMFQFLIGILKTWFAHHISHLWVLFQFLIGILKTPPDPHHTDPLQCVSIPYRYSKNVPPALGIVRLPAVFQFLIGILKTQCCRYPVYVRVLSFQFLIGILKTYLSFLIYGRRDSVSIPYRYSKNLWRCQNC